MAKRQMLLAGVTSDSTIYYVVNPADKVNSGVVVRGGDIAYVPFWSYVDRLGADLEPVTNNHFLRLLWNLEPKKNINTWAAKFFYRDVAFSQDDLDAIRPFLLDVPKEHKQKSDLVVEFLRINPLESKIDRLPRRRGEHSGSSRRLRTGLRQSLREEPYDPDAKDADGDGIVQEGTAWERPAGTRIFDATGREIQRGQISGNRSRSHRVVDADGKDVEYTPTYQRSEIGTIGRTVGTIRGAEQVDAIGQPSEPQKRPPTDVPDYIKTPVTSEERAIFTGRGRRSSYKDRLDEMRTGLSTRLRTIANRTGMERFLSAVGLRGSTAFDLGRLIPDDYEQQFVEDAEEYVEELAERGVYIAIPPGVFFGYPEGQPGEELFGISGVLRDGRIKNQFETGTSQGLLDGGYRRSYEAFGMGVPEDLPPEQRPIYGFVPRLMMDDGVNPDLSSEEAMIYGGGGYGRVAVRLRADVVDRTTISFDDSLDQQSFPIPLSRELRESHAQILGETYPDRDMSGEAMLLLGGSGRSLENDLGRRTADRLIGEALTGSDSLSDAWTPNERPGRVSEYIEAQIHGGVSLDDVEEVILDPDIPVFTDRGEWELLDIRDFLASDAPEAKLLHEKARKHGFAISYVDPEKGLVKHFTPQPRPSAVDTSEAPSAFTGSKPDPLPETAPVSPEIMLGVTAESGDRDELTEPVKPRAPYKPSPPPFSGLAADIVAAADGDFEKVLELLDEEGYWLIDFETTGFDHGNMPTQVAMVRVENGKVVRRINQFINPDRPLSEWSREHLRDGDGQPLTEEWLAANGISVDEAQKRLSSVLEGQIVVAHNAPFDMEVLQRIVSDNNGTLNMAGTIDTLALMRMAIPKGDGEDTGPKSHALGSLAEYLGYTLGDDAHDALADVDATNEVLRRGLVAAASNERAERGVLDNDFMSKLYEEQRSEYQVAVAKHRDAMRKYDRDMFEYRRALSGGVDAELPNVKVPYTPGPQKPDSVTASAKKNREDAMIAFRRLIIDVLAETDNSEGSVEEWIQLYSAIRDFQVGTLGRGAVSEATPEEAVRSMSQAERVAFLEQTIDLIIGPDTIVNEIVDNALTQYVDRELTKQVYIPATSTSAAQILRDERIPTPFEGPTNQITGSLRERATVETEMLGVPRGTADRSRPVYGYLPRTTDASFGTMGSSDPDPTKDPSTIHGQISVRLKDDVRSRSTATFGDSAAPGTGVAVPLTEEAREALLTSYPDPQVGTRTDVRNALFPAAVGDDFIPQIASIAAAAWLDRLPDTIAAAAKRRIRNAALTQSVLTPKPHYIEVQVHGGVALSDVAEIVLPNDLGRFGDDMEELLRLADDKAIRVVTADGRVPQKTEFGWIFVVPDATQAKSLDNPRIEIKAVRRGRTLIDEPYDPDAKDGDGDGIVQEWTVWERPAGTTLLLDGKPVTRGKQIASTALNARPSGLKVVDKDGNEVDYTPTYLPRPEEGTIGAGVGRLTPESDKPSAAKPAAASKPPKRGSPLSDVGGQSLAERGLSSVRQTARPQMPVSPEPAQEVERAGKRPRLRVVADRADVGKKYIIGLGEVYSDDEGTRNDYLRDYLENDAETLWETFLVRGLDELLEVEEINPTSPEGVDKLIDLLRPLLNGPNSRTTEGALRELIALNIERMVQDSGATPLGVWIQGITPLVLQVVRENFLADAIDALTEAYVDELELRTTGAPRIALTAGVLRKVLRSGRVLSQHESETSQGSYSPEFRKKVENRAMGVPFDLSDSLRPVYGFFADLNRMMDWDEDGNLTVTYGQRPGKADPSLRVPALDNETVRAYGDVQIVLKEDLRNRTTASIGDSFGLRKAASPVTNEGLERIGRAMGFVLPDGSVDMARTKMMVAIFGTAGPPSDALIIRAFSGLMDRQSPAKRQWLMKMLEASSPMRRSILTDFEYTEAQIHGGVDVEDIDRIILPQQSVRDSDSYAALLKEIVTLLEESGIPYEFQEL